MLLKGASVSYDKKIRENMDRIITHDALWRLDIPSKSFSDEVASWQDWLIVQECLNDIHQQIKYQGTEMWHCIIEQLKCVLYFDRNDI